MKIEGVQYCGLHLHATEHRDTRVGLNGEVRGKIAQSI